MINQLMSGGMKEILNRYWVLYGGFRALRQSPYLKIALLLNILLFPLWLEPRWWSLGMSILPNLLGFSLGGYAMLIGFGDEKFRQLISGPDDDGTPSPYLEVNATFVHFILLQMIALIICLFADAYHGYVPYVYELAAKKGVHHSVVLFSLAIPSFLGCLAFLYALLTAVAATFGVFRVASWYDDFLAEDRDRDDEQ